MNRRRAIPGAGASLRADLRRAASALLRAVGALTVAGAVVFGLRAGWRWLHHGERFTVQAISVTGIHRANEEELLRRAGIARGQNIFSLNTAVAAAAIEQVDWVERARVWRSLPSSVRIDVTEREPVALASTGRLFVIDAAGRRVKALSASDHLDLPAISGLMADDLGDETHPASPVGRAALEVLDAYLADRMAKVAPLSELHVSSAGGETAYSVFCGEDPAIEVVLGTFGAEPATEVHSVLRRFEQVWAELQSEGRRARSIDLGNRARPDWVSLRLVEPVAVAAERPR